VEGMYTVNVRYIQCQSSLCRDATRLFKDNLVIAEEIHSGLTKLLHFITSFTPFPKNIHSIIMRVI